MITILNLATSMSAIEHHDDREIPTISITVKSDCEYFDGMYLVELSTAKTNRTKVLVRNVEVTMPHDYAMGLEDAKLMIDIALDGILGNDIFFGKKILREGTEFADSINRAKTTAKHAQWRQRAYEVTKNDIFPAYDKVSFILVSNSSKSASTSAIGGSAGNATEFLKTAAGFFLSKQKTLYKQANRLDKAFDGFVILDSNSTEVALQTFVDAARVRIQNQDNFASNYSVKSATLDLEETIKSWDSSNLPAGWRKIRESDPGGRDRYLARRNTAGNYLNIVLIYKF